MKKALLVPALLLLACAAFAAPVTLEYRHEGSEVNKYRETNFITQKEDGNTVSVETITEITETVKAPMPDLKLESSVRTVGLKVNGEEQDVSKIPSSSFSYTLDRLGRVTGSWDKDGKTPDGFDPSKEIGLLPDKPVSKGDTWTGKLIMDTLNKPITLRLEDVYTKNGVEIARISFTADYEQGLDDVLGQGAEAAVGELGITGKTTVKGSGNIYFSTGLGKVIMLEYTLDRHLMLDGQGQHNEADEHEDYKMWRIE